MSSFVVLMDAQCRELFQDVKISSMCQRRGEAFPTVAVCHIVDGTLVIKRFHANTARWACEGVEPFCLAFLFAMRLRSLTMGSGKRDATRRDATRSFAPRNIACSVLLPATVLRKDASSSGCQRPLVTCKMVA